VVTALTINILGEPHATADELDGGGGLDSDLRRNFGPYVRKTRPVHPCGSKQAGTTIMNSSLHSLPKSALIGSRQAASYLGCSAQWLAVLRMRHAGPAYIKHGAWIRYRVGDLDAWTELHRITTGSLGAA